MPRLPSNLINLCCKVLLRCSEFDSDAALRAVFVTAELTPFRSGLLEADSKAARVDQVIAYLLPKRLSDGHAVLSLFVATLAKHYDASDDLHGDLQFLARDLGAGDALKFPMETDTSDTQPALRMAHRAQAILEEQAAEYTALTIPTHLKIELGEKRREVTELEACLNGLATAVSPAAPPPVQPSITITGDGNVVGERLIFMLSYGPGGRATATWTRPTVP